MRLVGLVVDHIRPIATETPATSRQSLTKFLAVARNSNIRVIAGAYFCLKLTRYAFLFWLPVYLTERLGLSAADAGYSSPPGASRSGR